MGLLIRLLALLFVMGLFTMAMGLLLAFTEPEPPLREDYSEDDF